MDTQVREQDAHQNGPEEKPSQELVGDHQKNTEMNTPMERVRWNDNADEYGLS